MKLGQSSILNFLKREKSNEGNTHLEKSKTILDNIGEKIMGQKIANT